MLRQFSEDDLLGNPLTGEQKSELLALVDQGDEGIDTSDIPEVRELPPGAIRGRPCRVRSIDLAADLHAYFSAIAARKGISLNDLINDILRTDVAIVETVK